MALPEREPVIELLYDFGWQSREVSPPIFDVEGQLVKERILRCLIPGGV
jgi:hypothetical protein